MKYFRLLVAFAKASFIADLEYRANFATRIVTDIFWYLAQIITFETIYQHTKKIGNWGVEEIRIFLGILFVLDALYMFFFSENLDKISDRIRKGEIDLLLAKPVSSQFMISFQRFNTAIIGNLFIGLAWLIFSLISYSQTHAETFHWLNLLWLIILIPCGLISIYIVRFTFSTMALFLTRAESIQYLWFQVYRLGMRPDSIYHPWLRFVILTIIPVATIASVPTSFIVEAPNPALLIWIVMSSAALLWLTQKLWKFSLKYYSSASS